MAEEKENLYGSYQASLTTGMGMSNVPVKQILKIEQKQNLFACSY
jgi:hypothetical protein